MGAAVIAGFIFCPEDPAAGGIDQNFPIAAMFAAKSDCNSVHQPGNTAAAVDHGFCVLKIRNGCQVQIAPGDPRGFCEGAAGSGTGSPGRRLVSVHHKNHPLPVVEIDHDRALIDRISLHLLPETHVIAPGVSTVLT